MQGLYEESNFSRSVGSKPSGHCSLESHDYKAETFSVSLQAWNKE